MIIAGVDEAGRGPVIGPMVMAICAIKEEDEHLLNKLGVADSKKLTPKKREELFPKILALVKYELAILSPEVIDSALNDPNMNLNKLEALTTSKLINILNAKKVILDLPTKDGELYKKEIRKNLKDLKIELIAEHKADDNYAICGAASIIAKVTRDREIEKLKHEIGIDFGSGYTSDGKTQDFIKKNHDKYSIFRKEWQTYKDVVDNKKQRKLFDF